MFYLIHIFFILNFALLPGRYDSKRQVSNFSLVESINTDSIDWYRPRFTEREEERFRMVEVFIQNNAYKPILDIHVLEAMRAVPRHKFVPSQFQDHAYMNHPLPLSQGQTISQPFIVAHMTELLQISAGDRILEIGTGSGYQAAVLSELTPFVYSIEIVDKLGKKAAVVLNELGYKTISLKIGDGYEGWEEHSPFDGIIVTCAPEKIPAPLLNQLKPGGRIVIPVGKAGMTQTLVVVEKDLKGKLKKQIQYPVVFVPMTGKAEEKK